MTPHASGPGGRRGQLIAAVSDAARAHSTATVLFHAAIADRFGLTAVDTKVIDLLARLGGLTSAELVAKTGLASASIAALLDRLESRELLRRTSDLADRRQVRFTLDPAGVQEIARAFGGLQAATDTLWAPYTIEQLELLRDFLDRATRFLTAYAERLPAAPPRTGEP